MNKKAKRKTRKQKIRSEIRRREELERLKNKIAEYEIKIADAKKNNIKEFNIRNLKVFVGTCNLLVPFVLMSGITVGGFKLFNGGFPFYRDDITKYKKYELEYETDSSINANSEFVRNEWWSDNIPTNSLTLYTPWEKQDDCYIQYIREYKIPHDCFFDVYEAIFNKDNDYIEETFEKENEEKIVSNEIPDGDNKYFLEAKLYMLDINDDLKIPESNTKNIIITIIEIIITLGVGGFIVYTREYSYLDDVWDINDTYHLNINPIGPLEKELEKMKKKKKTLIITRRGDSHGNK